jgi:enterochelin esterase-like enzyme
MKAMLLKLPRIGLAAATVVLALLGARGRALAQCGTMPPGTQAAMVPSTFMGAPERIVVYLPPNYATEAKRYPVVYWFHGRGDNECTQLPIAKNIQEAITAGVAAPMIYVFINGGSGCNFDDTACPGKMVESYVMKELIPYVDAHYRTVVGPQGRAVEGFSMGAEAVLRYYAKFPDQFCSAVSYAPIGGSALTQQTQDVIRAKGQPTLRLVVGTADNAHLPGARKYEQMLMSIMLPHEYEELPGVPHNPFALYGGMGGMVGRRGLQVHTRCFAAAAGGSADGGASDGGTSPSDAAGTGGAGGAPDLGAGGAGGASGGAGGGGAGQTGATGGAGGGSGGAGAGGSGGAGTGGAGVSSGGAGAPSSGGSPDVSSGGCSLAGARPWPGGLGVGVTLALLAVRRFRRRARRAGHKP